MKIANVNNNITFPSIQQLKKIKSTSNTNGKKMKIKNENEESSIKMDFKRLWNLIPFFIKFMSFTSLILYILNLLFKNISLYLSNIPLYTLYHFQLWRLFSSFLITTNIYNIILGLIFWVREASSMEARIGSLKYIIIFLRNNFFIQIIYTTLISLISLIIRNKNFMEKKIIYKKEDIYSVKNCGFWPGIMCELALLCLSNPNTKVKFLFIPFNFDAKYYPFIWYIFFCLVNTNNYNNDIEVLVGILFALIYQKYLKNFLNISDEYIDKIERNICCKCIINVNGFVSIKQINSKYEEDKSNKRMDIQVLNFNKKINRQLKNNKDNIERDISISNSELSNRSNKSDNSMISIIIPTKSIFDKSFIKNKMFS
jgi:hypothetical protein